MLKVLKSRSREGAPSLIKSVGHPMAIILSHYNAYFNSVKFTASTKYSWHFASAMSNSKDPTSTSKPIENTGKTFSVL